MRTEAPTFKRCCVCIPLRYGLISWGYLRLLLTILILSGLTYTLIEVVIYRGLSPTHGMVEILLLSLCIIIAQADIIMGVIFICGCHRKNAMLIKKYYYHNIFLLTMFIAIFLYNVGWILRGMIKYGGDGKELELTMYFIIDIVGYGTYIIVQLYVTLLVRSQFVKLENLCTFRFENNATEAECSMKISSSSRETPGDCDRKDANDSEELKQYV